MPLGSLIVPGLRDGGEPWELVTSGLGSDGVQPPGRFSPFNPDCNCCPDEEDCEDCVVRLNVTGFEPFTSEDPEDCESVNVNDLILPPVDGPHGDFLGAPLACQVELAPDCWFGRCFDGPNGQKWYWDAGVNGQNRGSKGWIVIVILSSEDGDHNIFWIGPEPGGYIDYDGPLEGLTFSLGPSDNCGNLGGHECPIGPNELISGTVDCDPPACIRPVDFLIHPQEEVGGECLRVCFETLLLACQDENACTFLWDFGDGQTSTEKDPCHLYMADGNYLVRLTVTCGTSVCTAEHSVTLDCEQEPPPPGPECTLCPVTPQKICLNFVGMTFCPCVVKGAELSGALAAHVIEWRNGTQNINSPFELDLVSQIGDECYWCYTGPLGGVEFWRTQPGDLNCANLAFDSAARIHIGFRLSQGDQGTLNLAVQMILIADKQVAGPTGNTFRHGHAFTSQAVNQPLADCNFNFVLFSDHIGDEFQICGNRVPVDFFFDRCWTWEIPAQTISAHSGNVHITGTPC